MKTIAVINQKGGVSKTTTTVHLGDYLSKKGYNVLLIDFDPQRDLSKSLGLFDQPNNIVDLLNGQIVEPIKLSENLSIVPGAKSLLFLKFSRKLAKKYIDQFSNDYDYCLIDCKPEIILDEVLTINEMVLVASDFILIPSDVNSNTINVTQEFIASIKRIKEKFNPKLNILGIFFSNVQDREIIFKQFYEHMKITFGEVFFDCYVKRDTKMMQATAMGQTIFEYDKDCRAAKDFAVLGDEVIKRLKNYE